jgi:membrane protein implicated in regulation of membrane protease activity
MNTKSIIYFGLCLVCIIIALVIFYTKFFNFMAFLFLILGVAAVLLFRQGRTEMKKKKE